MIKRSAHLTLIVFLVAALIAGPAYGNTAQKVPGTLIPGPAPSGPFVEGYAWAGGRDAGVINTAGEWVTERKFRIDFYSTGTYFRFSEGFSRANYLGQWLYIDYAGNIMLETDYEMVGDFHDGLASVKKNGKWGFIDKTGKVVIPLQYESVGKPQLMDVSVPGRFSEGLAAVELNGKWGYINKKGEMVIKPQFDGASTFNDGLAVVYIRNYKGGRSRYVAINKQGQVVIDKFNELSDFKDGLASFISIKNGRGFDYEYGIVDTKGNVIFRADSTSEISFLGSYGDGVFLTIPSVETGYGAVDRRGKRLIPPTYKHMEPFSEGFSLVTKYDGNKRLHAFVDKTGKEWMSFREGIFESFSGGLAYYQTKEARGYLRNPNDVIAPWAKQEVEQAISLGLVPAALQLQYASNINRSDFTRLIVRLIEEKKGQPIEEVLKTEGKMVDPDAFFDTKDRLILAAHSLGLVNGVAEREFRTYSELTREEAAVILERTARYLGVSPESTAEIAYADQEKIAPWAVKSIRFASAVKDRGNGASLMGSAGQNRFDPKGNLTRQQAYIIMKRLFNAS